MMFFSPLWPPALPDLRMEDGTPARPSVVKKLQEGEEMALAVTVWPEPYGYDATPKEERVEKLFSFDSDGIAQGVSWINERLETEADRWRKANESWR